MWRLFLFWQHETWRAWWRRPGVFIPAILAIIFVILGWFEASRLTPLDTVIMRYSIYFGTNWLAPSIGILLIPSLATFLVGLDLALAYVISRASLVLRYFWLWSAVFIASGFFWLLWLLYRINS